MRLRLTSKMNSSSCVQMHAGFVVTSCIAATELLLKAASLESLGYIRLTSMFGTDVRYGSQHGRQSALNKFNALTRL